MTAPVFGQRFAGAVWPASVAGECEHIELSSCLAELLTQVKSRLICGWILSTFSILHSRDCVFSFSGESDRCLSYVE